MKVGDKIIFDKYEWRVLDIKNNAALIITEYIIEQRSFHDAYKDITWADCSLRKYLVYIHGSGDIGIQGNNILKGNIGDGFCAGGVRPALWLNL